MTKKLLLWSSLSLNLMLMVMSVNPVTPLWLDQAATNLARTEMELMKVQTTMVQMEIENLLNQSPEIRSQVLLERSARSCQE